MKPKYKGYKYKWRRCKGCGKKSAGFRCWKCYSKDRFSTLSRGYSKARYQIKNKQIKDSTFTT